MKRYLKLAISLALVCLLFGYVPLLQDYYYYNYKGSSVVMITYAGNANGGGTGFQVKAPSGKKFILTNKHICEIKNSDGYVDVYDHEGNKNTLKVIEEYSEHDLCIIEPHPSLRPLSIAYNISITERVYLVGHPKLASLTFEKGYYRGDALIRLLGKCSNKNPGDLRDEINDLIEFLFKGCYESYNTFSFNLMSYGGNSGSPILDVYGNVISVLFAGNPGSPNFTYGVPLSAIHEFLNDK